MTEKTTAQELVGKDLKSFKIVEMTEVYRINDDGRKIETLGFFKNWNTAEAFAGAQTDSYWHRTGQALVLTDGNIGYVISHQDSVNLFDEEIEAVEIKKKALAKLTTAERKLLGFE